MDNIITHKEALKEIFEVELLDEGRLEGVCDGVLISSGSDVPGTYFNFIVLGDFFAQDVIKGDLSDKYLNIAQDVMCVSIRKDEADNEAKSEYRAWFLSKIVRTILTLNRKLISDTYPEGVARTTVLSGSPLQSVVYWDNIAHMVTITLDIKMTEEDY